MSDEIDRFLEGFAPDIRAVAQQVRTLVASITPDADENLKLGWKVIWYGFGPKMPAQFAVLMPTKAHVGLGLAHGAELPDAKRRLEGTGKRMRHVKLRTEEDVADPAIAALLRAEVARTRAELREGKRAPAARIMAKGRAPASRAKSPRRKPASSRSGARPARAR